MKEFKSPYKQLDRKVNTWCKYTKRLDTYGCGCQHDCSYCYSKSLLLFRNLWDINNPSIASIQDIRDRILKLKISDIVRIGYMTDCFQPIENKYGITYKTIRLLNIYKINYLIVTKSDLVASDKYLNLYDPELAHFQITITSTKNCIDYEKAPSFKKKVRAIEKLEKMGYDISLRLSPYIPENIDLTSINNIGCKKILIEFLKVNHNIRKWFDIDYSKHTLKYGGYENLQLENKIQLVNKITGFDQVSIGEYVKEHHLYFSQNVNYNSEDCCNLNTLTILPEPQLNLFNHET